MKPAECDLCWPFECSGRHDDGKPRDFNVNPLTEADLLGILERQRQDQKRVDAIGRARWLIASIESAMKDSTDPEMREAWRKALANANLAGSLLLAQRPGRPPVKE